MSLFGHRRIRGCKNFSHTATHGPLLIGSLAFGFRAWMCFKVEGFVSRCFGYLADYMADENVGVALQIVLAAALCLRMSNQNCIANVSYQT